MPVASLTVADKVYDVAVFGLAGTDVSSIDEVRQVVAVVATEGRFVTPGSTADTRMSYVVPLVNPVSVAEVSDAFAVCDHSDHAVSACGLYSTL